jgi:hypothetical protein
MDATMNKKQKLDHVVQITGLNRETVKDLLKKGWTVAKYDSGQILFYSPQAKEIAS